LHVPWVPVAMVAFLFLMRFMGPAQHVRHVIAWIGGDEYTPIQFTITLTLFLPMHEYTKYVCVVKLFFG
jgi:hypothetical protein